MLKIENLGKIIDGVEILSDINIEMKPGKIYGVVGKNAIYNKNADYFSSNKKMVNAYIEAKHLLMKKYRIE